MQRREFLKASLGSALAPKLAHETLLGFVPDIVEQPSKVGRTLEHHRFGVTYTPTRNWFFCWNDFNPSRIAQDLDGVCNLGADHIRMMLMWPDFQPNRQWISPAHLERLDHFMTLSGKRGLDVQLCMLNGFVSGLKFLPSYIVGRSATEFYKSSSVWQAQELFFRSVAGLVSTHRNFLGFDLANEMPNAWSTGEDTKTGDAWCARMLTLCDELAPGKPHVNGAWGHWFFRDTFSAGFMAKRPAAAVMHCYGRYAGAPGSLLEPPSITLPASTAALVRSYAGNPNKPVWCQEFGCTNAWNSESEIASFIEKTTLDGIAGGVNWFTWWCSHDLNQNMEFDPSEYQFGLITNDGKLKPQGKAFKEVAEAYRGKPVRIPVQRGIAKAPPETYAQTWPWLLQWIKENRH